MFRRFPIKPFVKPNTGQVKPPKEYDIEYVPYTHQRADNPTKAIVKVPSNNTNQELSSDWGSKFDIKK